MNKKNKYILNFIGLLFLSFTCSAAQKHDCKEIIDTKVQSREFITGNVGYGELKKQVIQQALLDAVKQTLGTEVRTHSGMKLQSDDGVESERFRELTAEKAKGFVKKYKITKEDIVDKGAITLLEIAIDASICIPKRTEVKELVVMGDFFIDDQNSIKFKKVMMTGFPQKNKYYSLVAGKPDEVFHDIRIQGRLIDSSVKKETRQDAQKRLDNLNSNIKLLSKLFKKDEKKYTSKKVERKTIINVEVITEALIVADQELITETVNLTKMIPLNSSHETVQNDLVKKAVKDSSKKLFKKLTKRVERADGNKQERFDIRYNN